MCSLKGIRPGTPVLPESHAKQVAASSHENKTGLWRNKRAFKNSLEVISNPISKASLDKLRPLQAFILTTFSVLQFALAK